jgi:hypothetical protein
MKIMKNRNDYGSIPLFSAANKWLSLLAFFKAKITILFYAKHVSIKRIIEPTVLYSFVFLMQKKVIWWTRYNCRKERKRFHLSSNFFTLLFGFVSLRWHLFLRREKSGRKFQYGTQRTTASRIQIW